MKGASEGDQARHNFSFLWSAAKIMKGKGQAAKEKKIKDQSREVQRIQSYVARFLGVRQLVRDHCQCWKVAH
jgi:hypothetical protein